MLSTSAAIRGPWQSSNAQPKAAAACSHRAHACGTFLSLPSKSSWLPTPGKAASATADMHTMGVIWHMLMVCRRCTTTSMGCCCCRDRASIAWQINGEPPPCSVSKSVRHWPSLPPTVLLALAWQWTYLLRQGICHTGRNECAL